MESIRNRGKAGNQEIKAELIKRSLDIFRGILPEEDRKKLLAIDRKTMGKYLYRTMAEGFTQKKQRGR
jgi:hypothetical protein